MTEKAPSRLDPSQSFRGPIFIVGMHRSGTKLIRDLLNQNPSVGIPIAESHFIPHLMRRFGRPPQLERKAKRFELFNYLRNTTFCYNMSSAGYDLTAEDFHKAESWNDWASIIERFLRHYAPEGRSEPFLWGDKTPGYVNHLAALKAEFPSARFVHIIRDPRDYALSVRSAWGKSLMRAAALWSETLAITRRKAEKISGDYLEVRYEDLLGSSRLVMQTVAEFLGIDFLPTMIELKEPADNLGNTRGRKEIVATNQGKYRIKLSATQIQRIEELTWPLMEEYGYEPEFAKSARPMTSAESLILKVSDGLASARFHMQDKGTITGLRYFSHLHFESSWRS